MPMHGVITWQDHCSDSGSIRGPSSCSTYPERPGEEFTNKSLSLGSQLRIEFQWRKHNLIQKNGLPIHHLPLTQTALTIHVDASDTGWRVHSQVISKAGYWTEKEKQNSINVRELTAIYSIVHYSST